MKKVRIALLGFGTVGQAVYKNLKENKDIIAKKNGVEFEIPYIFVRNPQRYTSLVNDSSSLVQDYETIVKDQSIDVIIELMGGIEPAFSFVKSALEAGKSVVTANKALLAEKVQDIEPLVRDGKGALYFEAAVAGGIPIISSIKSAFSGNRIESVQGILNGTCNYILTRMEEAALDYPEALNEASEKGYAEADPTFDIDGIDAAHKIAILGGLSFGQTVPFKNIKKIKGIRDVRAYDIKAAQDFGFRIRLIGSASLIDGKLDLRVEPSLVPLSHPLASVRDVFNAVFIASHPVGETMFLGRGAGGDPTSSAVIGDLIQCALRGETLGALYFNEIHKGSELAEEGKPSRYYFRALVEDKPGVLAKIAGILGQWNISILSVQQMSPLEDGTVPLVLSTHVARESEMMNAFNEIRESKEIHIVNPLVMTILE